MKRRILFLALLAVMLVPGMVQAEKSVTISFSQIVEHPALDAVRQGFKDYFAEKEKGVKVTYHDHIAQGNMATNVQIAAQILGEKPDIAVGISTPSAQALAQKIKDIPILFTAVTDPVTAGLAASLEEPGGNVTGMSDMSPVERQVKLILEVVPGAKTIGVIYNSGEANSVVLVNVLKEVCQKLGLNKVEEATVVNSGGVYQAAKSLVGRCDAVYIPTDNTVVSALESAIKVCRENKLPLFAADTDSVQRGVIAALAVDYYRMGRQTGRMARRILFQRTMPDKMPVEFLEDLMLYVNPSAAAAMGVKLPEKVVQRADKIIK